MPIATSPFNDANRLVSNNGWQQIQGTNGGNIYGDTLSVGGTPTQGSTTINLTLRQRPDLYFENGYTVMYTGALAIAGTVGSTSNRIWSHTILYPTNNNTIPCGQLTFPEYAA